MSEFKPQHSPPECVWLFYDDRWDFSFDEPNAHGRRYYGRKGRCIVRMVPETDVAAARASALEEAAKVVEAWEGEIDPGEMLDLLAERIRALKETP